MSSRSRYTYTPTYNRQNSWSDPPKKMAKTQPKRKKSPPGGGSGSRPKPRTARDMADVILAAVIVFAVPLLGLIALFSRPVRWLVLVVALVSMFIMWGARSFLPKARAMFSGFLALVSLLSLIGTFQRPEETTNFPQFGTYSNGTDPITAGGNATSSLDPTLVGLSDGSLGQTEDPLNNVDDPATPVETGAGRTISDAERVLESYLELWKLGVNWIDMVQYTSPEWRNTVESPNRQLFFQHFEKTLLSWTITPPVINDSDTAATIELIAFQELSSGIQAKTRYNVIMQRYDDTWYVDPSSLVTGIAVVDPTPTPDPNTTATPAPTATIKPSTTLYYNKAGSGVKYHTSQTCSSMNEKYHNKLTSFKYSQLNDKEFSALEPCSVCKAPKRP